MQIIYFSSKLTNVLAVILLWAALQVTIPLFCLKISDKWLSSSSALFKTYKWERDGDFYNKIFRIRKWKKLLPDGGALVKNGFKKKNIDASSLENLHKFNIESCRAELVHWILMFPFWVVGFIAPPIVIPCILLYALVANLPCIIAQRYNRPRITKLLVKIQARAAKNNSNDFEI